MVDEFCCISVHLSSVSFISLLHLHWKLCHLILVCHTGLSWRWGGVDTWLAPHRWYGMIFPASVGSAWALLSHILEFKGADKYCTDSWNFRKTKQKHVVSVIVFARNTLIEADALVVKHKFNDQPCKGNDRFWFYKEFDWFMKCT